MTNLKVLQLADKFADTVNQDVNEQFQRQRGRLQQFSHDLQMKLRILLGEMEGDIRVLKERNFDKKILKIMIKIWSDVLSIAKELNKEKPYPTAERLIAYIQNKRTRSLIENLDFLTEHYIKSTNVDFKPGGFVQHPEIRSLKLLKALAHHLDKYLAENPLLPVPSDKPPANIDIPLLNVKPEPIVQSPGQEALTNPGVPDAKKKPFNPSSFDRSWGEEPL